MKIYTKTGDSGTTGLFAGPRVSKSDPRIAAYGSVDELNAVLGVVLSTCGSDVALSEGLTQVQSDLFSIGAELATPDPVAQQMCLLTKERISALEGWIDAVDEQLEPLKAFVLPGGSTPSAMLHWARTVCRRAERDVVFLAQQPQVADCSRVIIYLNRLSDLLFMLARQQNAHAGIADRPWTK